jgi:hypothetical protein
VGVLVGHWLAYTVAFPAVAVRQYVLQEAGHSYWLNAVRFAVVLAVAGLAVVVGRHARSALDPATESFTSVARRLAGAQVSAFAAMEVVERLVSGAPLGHLLDHNVFFLGLAAQVVVACAGALFLLWFGRATASLVAAFRRGAWPRARATLARPLSAAVRPVPALAGAAGVRGPPPR